MDYTIPCRVVPDRDETQERAPEEDRAEEIRRAVAVIERHIADLTAERERLTRAMAEADRKAADIVGALHEMLVRYEEAMKA